MVGIDATNVVDGLDEGVESAQSIALIECDIRLVSNAVGRCSVDDGLIEIKDGVLVIFNTCWHLVDVGVETYAEKSLLCENFLDKFLSVHGLYILKFI